ncbi:MAG: ABC transporter permease subunit, partial [Chloroflexota bacterium]
AIFLIFLSCFFPLVVATSIAVGSINKVYFQVAANFNFSSADVLFKVIIPAIIPDMVTALRLTISVAWLVVVAAEMIAVQSGLGFLILDSRNALRMDEVIVAMIVIGIIGLILDSIVKQLGKGKSSVWKQIP